MPFALALQTEPSAGSTSSELHLLLGTDEERGLHLRDLATTIPLVNFTVCHSPRRSMDRRF
jgi:hypothetical protein